MATQMALGERRMSTDTASTCASNLEDLSSDESGTDQAHGAEQQSKQQAEQQSKKQAEHLNGYRYRKLDDVIQNIRRKRARDQVLDEVGSTCSFASFGTMDSLGEFAGPMAKRIHTRCMSGEPSLVGPCAIPHIPRHVGHPKTQRSQLRKYFYDVREIDTDKYVRDAWKW